MRINQNPTHNTEFEEREVFRHQREKDRKWAVALKSKPAGICKWQFYNQQCCGADRVSLSVQSQSSKLPEGTLSPPPPPNNGQFFSSQTGNSLLHEYFKKPISILGKLQPRWLVLTLYGVYTSTYLCHKHKKSFIDYSKSILGFYSLGEEDNSRLVSQPVTARSWSTRSSLNDCMMHMS